MGHWWNDTCQGRNKLCTITHGPVPLCVP